METEERNLMWLRATINHNNDVSDKVRGVSYTVGDLHTNNFVDP